jgi:hypothetical protein
MNVVPSASMTSGVSHSEIGLPPSLAAAEACRPLEAAALRRKRTSKSVDDAVRASSVELVAGRSTSSSQTGIPRVQAAGSSTSAGSERSVGVVRTVSARM